MIKALRIEVSGKVQGVFFRASTVEQAKGIGHISGYIQNLPNSNVLIIAQGEEIRLNKLLDWLKDGPKLAKVKSINIKDIKQEPFDNFEIRKQDYSELRDK